jgi:hypothetical protein
MQRLLTRGATTRIPYLTMAPAYEAAVLEVLAGLCEQGLVYKALKPVHWSVANETALAEAELEYEDREDVSVYVDFRGARTRRRSTPRSACPRTIRKSEDLHGLTPELHDLDDHALDAPGEPGDRGEREV